MTMKNDDDDGDGVDTGSEEQQQGCGGSNGWWIEQGLIFCQVSFLLFWSIEKV